MNKNLKVVVATSLKRYFDETCLFQFDDLSHKSSASSLNQNLPPPSNNDSVDNVNIADTMKKTATLPKITKAETIACQDEWEQKLYRNKVKRKNTFHFFLLLFICFYMFLLIFILHIDSH